MFSHVLTPRFGDLDIYNHVNNAVFMTYLEEARVAFAQQSGLRALFTRAQSTVIARVEADYKSPAFLGDVLCIALAVSDIRRSSYSYAYRVTRPADEKLILTGATTQVCFNFELNAPVRVPEAWRALLAQYVVA